MKLQKRPKRGTTKSFSNYIVKMKDYNCGKGGAFTPRYDQESNRFKKPIER